MFSSSSDHLLFGGCAFVTASDGHFSPIRWVLKVNLLFSLLFARFCSFLSGSVFLSVIFLRDICLWLRGIWNSSVPPYTKGRYPPFQRSGWQVPRSWASHTEQSLPLKSSLRNWNSWLPASQLQGTSGHCRHKTSSSNPVMPTDGTVCFFSFVTAWDSADIFDPSLCCLFASLSKKSFSLECCVSPQICLVCCVFS